MVTYSRINRIVGVSTILFLLFLLIFSGCGWRNDKPSQPQGTPEDEFTFLFFSDTQADPATGDYSAAGLLVASAVAASTAGEHPPGLVIFGGDTVNDGGDPSEWQTFWQAFALPLDNLKTAAVPGNHDHYPLLAGQFCYPQSVPSATDDGYFYSFNMGQIHFTMLDSYIMGAARQEDIDWLRNDLESPAASEAKWRIAVMHHPMWPPVNNPRDAARAETMRRYFLPVLEDFGVDLILCGHHHIYTRTLPMSGNQPQEPEESGRRAGIVQIMVASGDKVSYAIGDTDLFASNSLAPNYLMVTATAETLYITALNGDNEPIDAYIINTG